MRIRPWTTLPLRVRLRIEGRINDRVRKRQEEAVDPRAFIPGPRPDVDANGFLSVEIHPYAQLGHQVASWMSGFLWAQDLGLGYLGGELSRDRDRLYDFSGQQLAVPRGRHKVIRLPSTLDERHRTSQATLLGRIHEARQRYPNRILIFRLSLDQARWDHTPAAGVLRLAMLAGRLGALLTDRERGAAYAAIHIRRASFADDISKEENPNRWVDEHWYVDLIEKLRHESAVARLPIRVYAMGNEADFPELSALEGVTLILDGDRDDDLVDLCAARLLVAAPSSFSFNAALASKSPVLVRVPWWHHVPDAGRWIPVSHDGDYDLARLHRAFQDVSEREE